MAIGAIVGGAMRLGSQIYGGIQQRKALKRMQNNINQLAADNQNWYDRRYNEDATQRADAQRLINMTNESIKNRNRQAADTAAVMGGDVGLASAMAKDANNSALSDTIGNIAATADARKDSIENQYMAQKADIIGQQNAIEGAKMNQIANATNAMAGSAGNIGESLTDFIEAKKLEKNK